MARAASTRIREELTRTSDTLAQITGNPVHFFRPPYGARRPFALRTARDLGMTPVTWNAMTNDWVEPSADRIAVELIKRVDQNKKRGLASNIVLHDGGHHGLGENRSPSVNAAELLLARYAANRRFVTLDAWI